MKAIFARLRNALDIGQNAPDLPMPNRIYTPYVWFWHVVTALIYLGFAIGTIWQERAALSWRVGLVVLLLMVQLGVYLRLYVFNTRWPVPLWQQAIYFGGGIAAWLIQVQLFPHFTGLIFMFFGQAFGLLPPLPAIITVTAVILLFVLQTSGWRLDDLDLNAVTSMGGLWLFAVPVYLLLYYAMRTSSERGRLIAELEAARRELERSRQRDVELAVLRERERIARDMHDSLGHALVALSVQLEAAQRLYRVNVQSADEHMEAMKALVRESMATLRRTIAGLRTPVLGDRPLRLALQEHCLGVSQRTGMAIACRVDEAADRLPPALAETLWAVAQEALTNVEKHAQARRVEVTLKVAEDEVRLRVQDDGVGLPPDALSRAGRYGLRGMRERIEGVGGALEIHPPRVAGARQTSGAIIEARAPLISG
ncbi:MAG: sensor histidine kinase [Anaerolineae bacterium]|nr:sensor histidine kinase [Candidatus Roseilinea sp.]MDW8448391.1 sensor histidine kinase [Anaerolineae bacterium]